MSKAISLVLSPVVTEYFHRLCNPTVIIANHSSKDY